MPAAAEGQGQAGVSKQKPTQHQLQRNMATKPPAAQSVLLVLYLCRANLVAATGSVCPAGTRPPSPWHLQVRAELLGFQAAELPAPQLAVEEKAPGLRENSTG